MLSLVRHGRLTACLEAALTVIADPAEDDRIKQYAAAALRDCADVQMKTRLKEIVDTFATISNGLAGVICEALYPDAIDASGLAGLIRRTEPQSRHGSHLLWTLKHHLEEKLTPSLAALLLEVVVELLHTAPYLEHGQDVEPISSRFSWLCDIVPIILKKLLADYHLSLCAAKVIARGIRIMEAHRHYGGYSEEKEYQEVSDAIYSHPIVKREYLWQGVAKYRDSHQREPGWLLQATGWHHQIISFNNSDIFWMTADAGQLEAYEDRLLSMRFAFELWQPYRFQWKQWFALLHVQFAMHEFHSLFWKYTWQRLTAPIISFWYRQIKYKFLEDYWWRRKGWRLQRAMGWIKDQYILHRHIYRLYSGTAIQWIGNLSHEARSKGNSLSWAADDWAALKRRRGPAIAWAVRHGCEVVWVRHTPILPHERPVLNQTNTQIVIGLCGLQSLWQKGQINFSALSDQEAERACRFALWELNGFPDWLPDFVGAKPQIFRQTLRACIEGEWRYERDREYVSETLYKLRWHGERYWSLVASDLLAQLQRQNPSHPEILDYAISILLKSGNIYHSELSTLASKRIENYASDSPFFFTWLSVWLQLNAIAALTWLNAYLAELPSPQADELVLHMCASLHEYRSRSIPQVARPEYLQPSAMRLFIPMIYRHVRPSEDIDRANGEAYTPTPRDDAQHFRNSLLQRLAQLDDPDVLTALKELKTAPELSKYQDWITHLIEQHLAQRVDLPPMKVDDFRTFSEGLETNPRNDTELFRIACWRLQDIKHEVEQTENSLREEVHKDWDEAALRRWFQRKLNERSRQRYNIPQEAEIDFGQKPDLRFEYPGIPAVPVELKWAENWTAPELLERLENQLVGQYLRAYNVRYGIYLLGYIGRQQQWNHPTEKRYIDFSELVRLLEDKALEIEKTCHDVVEIRVVAVDFRIHS